MAMVQTARAGADLHVSLTTKGTRTMMNKRASPPQDFAKRAEYTRGE